MLRENDFANGPAQGTSPETKEERARRKALGIYYTPPDVAKVLARWVIQHPDEVVLEPSFGGCSMLSAAVDVFHALGNRSPSRQLYGFDIDEAAFLHLAEMGVDNSEARFRKADFLQCQADDLQVDAVLANPPFVSYHSQNEQQRQLTEKLRQKYFPKLPRLASLWAFFVLHSMSFLRPGGRMGFVLPIAIGTTDYGRVLLGHLATLFAKVELVHVGERVFAQAGTDERIALLLLSDYCPGGVETPQPAEVSYISRIAGEKDGNAVCLDHHLTTQATDVAAEATAKLDLMMEGGQLIELGSIASVRIGEVVGDIPFFVKTRSEWRALKISEKYLSPLLTRASQVSGLSARTDGVKGSQVTIPDLLLPPVNRTPKSIDSYLSLYAQEEIDTNRTFEKRSVWYRCSYDSTADAFIGSMNHEYPKVIGNDDGISCSNSFYKITLVDHKAYAAWLPMLSLSTPFRVSAEICGRVRGSGGFKLEPSDVKRLALPSTLPKLSKSDFKELRARVDKLLCQGELDAAGQIVDAVVYLRTRVVSASTMNALRANRMSLTARRLKKT